MEIKLGSNRIAETTRKLDKRKRDNKNMQGNTPSLKPSKSTKPKK